ncbi:uncharacterized protein MYCFIDRAFT_202862 [Pseudocercospora fijiensis CIRAD86]|uniref:Uncharacterized protein n=1 Tax=Pseudocercospora fijiensis (strain CIRAD86) TaxID=383855 RepID=M2ZYK1_PSEFD|nr:uncharacterized protein MYCFIDRAFT_202862 [Pseudocercospora fijiensis CIRAD86]EME84029.1 hypothetical protein MYCFIDRAFT_202862 [Pseudocercospora fijiensis CIRAD86]
MMSSLCRITGDMRIMSHGMIFDVKQLSYWRSDNPEGMRCAHADERIDDNRYDEDDVEDVAQNDDDEEGDDEEDEEIEDEDENIVFEEAIRHIYARKILLSSRSPEKYPIWSELFEEIAKYLQGRPDTLLQKAQKLNESRTLFPWLVEIGLLGQRKDGRCRLAQGMRSKFREQGR